MSRNSLQTSCLGFRLNEVLKKPLDKLPVTKDFPRLAHKFKIFHYNEKTKEYEEQILPETDSVELLCFDILNCLQKNILRKNESLDKEEYLRSVQIVNDETLTGYMIKKFGNDNQVVKILKATCQSIVITLMVIVKFPLQQLHNIIFKDNRGEWRLFIHTGGDRPCLTHRRSEEVYRQAKAKEGSLFKTCFYFDWEMRLYFNPKTYDFEEVKVEFLNINFPKDVNPKIYEKQVQTLKEFFTISSKLESAQKREWPSWRFALLASAVIAIGAIFFKEVFFNRV